MRRDKRYATRSVQPAQSGPTAVSCTPPQAKTPPVRPDRGNKTPLLHGINGESPGTDQSDDSPKTFRSRLRKNTSGNVDQLRQSTRLRKFDNGKVQENGDIEDDMLCAQPQSYIGCEGDGHGKRKQSVDLQSGTTMIKLENMEDTANFLPDNHFCPKKVLLSAGESDYTNNGNLSSSRQKKRNLVGWQDHLCQVGSNGHLSSSGDGQVMSSGMIGSVGTCTETKCSNYSARNVQCQEEVTVSKTGLTDISVCKRNRPLSHVNQSDDSKPREKRVTVKAEKVPCPPSPLSHDTRPGLDDEQTENCIVVKMEVPTEQHYAYERNSPRQSPLPLRNHVSSYKFQSLKIDRCSPGPTSCDLSSSCKLDQINQGACSQQKSLENSVTLDENFIGSVAHNEHLEMYTLENRKSRTFQKISRKSKSKSLNNEYRENKVTKSSPTEELYQSHSSSNPSSSSSSSNLPPPPPLIIPPPTSFPSSIQSQNSKLFSSEASGFHSEASCVKLSLQYEQTSVINQRCQVLPPRKIQGRHSWPLNSSLLKEEVGRNFGQPLREGPSPPVFKNVSEALHRLPESPKVPLVCMKDVIVIDSSPGSETSIVSSQSSSPERSPTAKSLLHPRRANTSSKSKTAQRLCFGHEKESTPSAYKTKNLKDKSVSLDKSLGGGAKKDNYNKASCSKVSGNSLTSRAMEKVSSVNNSDLILSRTDRIRSPSIRYKDDVLFFPLVFPSRSSQSATNRVSEAVETKSNNRQVQAELDEKVIPKKENVLENVKTVEKINCQSENNTDSVSAASSKQTESLDRRRILRGSSVKSENVAVTQDAAAAESLVSTLHSTNMELNLTRCPSALSSDSSFLPPKSNKVLRSQLSSLKTLASHSLPPSSASPPLSPSASSSSQARNPEQKCSTGGRPSPTDSANFTEELKTDQTGPSTNTSEPKITTSDAKATITDQVDRTQKTKIKQKEPNSSHPTRTSSIDPEDRTQGLETKKEQNNTNPIIDQSERIHEVKIKQEHNTNTIQPKVTTSNAKGTITDVAYKSSSLEDPSTIKVPKTVSKLQSCLRSHSSMSTGIKEPKPLSILSRPERALSESKKLNAFVSDELDKYLAQEIGNYAISPRKIGVSTSDSLPSSKKTSLGENRKVVSKKLSFSSKKNSCDKNLITCKIEQSDYNRAEKTMTAVAYNTRSNSNCMSPEKDDNKSSNSSNSSDMTQISSKGDSDAASPEKQTSIVSETELLPPPTTSPSKISEKQMCTRRETGSLPTETPTPVSSKIIEKPTRTRSEKCPFSTPTSSKISENQTYSEPGPTPTPASSDCQNTRTLRPRSEQLTARINKPGSSYSNCSVFTSNTQSYEPDFDEVDGILFMSFPNVESLQAHIAVERKSNWESAPSHMSSISKVLNFNRWKERHKTKLPRPAFDKSKNLRGLHMRMKMYYKLLRSEWHKIKQRNQHRSRYGFKKTNDFSKIKSWQTRLNKNLESKRNSKKIHWRTQDQLARSLKSDEIRQIGIVKKHRKNFIFTRHRSCKHTYASEDEELENSSIPHEDEDQSGNGRKKQNIPTSSNLAGSGSVSGSNSGSECLQAVVKSAHLLYESEEINLIKKLGGIDPSDYAMRKRTRSQVELENLHRRSKNLPPIALDWINHNMARIAMTALHDDFVKKKSPTAGKNVSNVNSEGKHNTDTFIQVDSKVARVRSSEESSLPPLFESQKSQLPSSRPPSSAVRLCKTSDEDLAKETARILLTRQKLKAKDQKCNKPGCRYGCICHLCWISENFEDSSKMSAICTKTCDKEYCRLGCICDSNDNIKLESMCHEQTCTLECCRCSEHESVTPKSGRKKESLKSTPAIDSDVIVISPEKLTDDPEPEPSQEVTKCKSADISDSPNCKTFNTDNTEGIKKTSDVCTEKLKCLRRERSTSLPKRESTYRDGKNVVASSRKPLTIEGSEIFQGKKKRKLNFDANCSKVNFTKVKQLQTKSSSAYAEDEKDNSKTVPHSNSIKRLCPLRDDCRQPLEQCYVNCSWFPANTFDNCVVEIDRLGSPQQMRQLGCMSVDCFPQSTKVRTSQQMENSSCNSSASSSSSTNASNSNRHTDCIKCELIDLSPIKVKPSTEVMSLPDAKVTDSPPPETKSNSISPPRLLVEVANSEKWSCPLVDLTDMSAEDPSESRTDKDWQVKMICLKAKQDAGPSTQSMEEGYQLLEFISNCNWDSHSSDVICRVSLCCEPGKYPDPQKMAVGNFDVEILPKSNKAPTVPVRLQSEIFCCPYNIRVKVTDRTKGTGSEEKVEPLLEGCSYVGISSVRSIRNNNQLDIKSMSLIATLQDINYQCQEDNEQNDLPNEAKNVVGEIEVLEIHPPLQEKIPERALVLDLSPENQKPVPPEEVTGLSSTKSCKQTSNSSEEIGSQLSSENLTATGTDFALKSKKSLTEEETKMKNTADTSSNVRVCRQRSREKTAVVVRDWPLRSKLGKAVKQESHSVTDPSVRRNLTKSMNNCDAQHEYSNLVPQESCETIIKRDARNVSVVITPKLMRTRNNIRKNKSSDCDSAQQLPNDSTESKTDLSPNCSMQNLKPAEDEVCELKSPSGRTAIEQSLMKISPGHSLNGGFFVTSSQPGVGPICFGHLHGCSLVPSDLNNHTACSNFPNACTFGSVPTNQLLQLVPVPVPVSFSVAPDGSTVNTNVTIPVLNSKTSPCIASSSSSSHSAIADKTCCSSHSVTSGTTCCSSHSLTPGTTCSDPHSITTGTTCCSSHSMTTSMTCCRSHSVTTGTTCCNSCCSTLPVTHNMNNSCISVTNSNSCCNMESAENNTKNLVNDPSLPLPVAQPGHILVSQGQNNAILVPYKTFIKKTTDIDSQEHCTDKCLLSDKSTANKYEDLKEVKNIANTNNELFNCKDNHPQLSPNDDSVCDVPSENIKQEEIEKEKKLCAKESQMKEEPASMDDEPVNCLSSLQSGLNFDFRQDPIDENDFDDEDWADFDDFDQSGKDRRNRYQLSVHKTRERERRCNIFNGINILQEVLCKNENIQFISQRKILDFATDHIKSLQITEEEMTGEKTSLGKINHQLWEQLNKVKDKLKLQNITECEQNKILDESGLPFDMYMPPARDSTKLEDDVGSPLKLLPALDSYEASDVELKDHSDIEFELDVRLVSSSLPPRSPSPLSGPLNEVHSSNEDTILMSPVTSPQMQDLDDDVEKAEQESLCFNSSNPESEKDL